MKNHTPMLSAGLQAVLVSAIVAVGLLLLAVLA